MHIRISMSLAKMKHRRVHSCGIYRHDVSTCFKPMGYNCMKKVAGSEKTWMEPPALR
jgi:Leu/Phe-tRNA-protein transferase